MQPVISKYESVSYWETMLTRCDVWQGCLSPAMRMVDPVIVNTTVIDQRIDLLDNNWACYPDMRSVLGFMQYIFLPMAFYLKLHPENDCLYIPLDDPAFFLSTIKKSDVPERDEMTGCLRTLDALWLLPDAKLPKALLDYCAAFNRQWNGNTSIFHIQPFQNTHAVAQRIRQEIWSESMLKEDLGLSARALDEFCTQFYKAPRIRDLFLRFLNHRVGCLI